MSKNVILNGTTHIGISDATLPVVGGTEAIFRDVDEIPVVSLQEKTATVNGEVLPDEGYDGLSRVTVNVEGGSGEDWLEANAVIVPALKAGANNGDLPENLTLNMPLAGFNPNVIIIACGTTAAQGAWFSSGCKNLTLNVKTATLAKLFLVDKSIETVTVNASDGKFALYRGCFFGCPNLTTINGTITGLDNAGVGGSGTTNDTFYGCASLANVTFAPNIINFNTKLNTGAVNGVYPTDNFTNETLVSLANALMNVPESSLTLTLSTTAKAKLAGIMGDVSQVTDGDTSYDLFTANEAGSTSLESFITTTKGWTLG